MPIKYFFTFLSKKYNRVPLGFDPLVARLLGHDPTSDQLVQCHNNKLRAIDQMSSAYVCTNVYCTSMDHRNEINLLCNCIIESCVASGLYSIG